jgi:DmsE family decaheme c-type cytochrome
MFTRVGGPLTFLKTALLVAVPLVTLALAGCDALKVSKPILAQKEYEKLIVGRFDADYVGTTTCLRVCHYHDQIRQDFEASTMGAQMSPATGMPLVDCETCHGPGSLAIQDITEEKVKADAARGIRTECDYETLIDFDELPAAALSLICLKCHTANATFNLHNWNAGSHALNDVSCSDCHSIHAGPDLIVKPRETPDMCYACHEDIKAEFSMPTHHPVPERRVICSDCHEPHGTLARSLLRRDSVRAACAQCHAEKEGPFVFEHGDVTEDCTNCHTPHGSVNDFLLTESVPFLCLECHDGHSVSDDRETRAAFHTRCTDCHSAIHGTDIPSANPARPGIFLQ